jgi:hypothetical protein
LLFVRLIQFAGLAVEFFLQIGNGRIAAARRYRRAARLRFGYLATPRFASATAYSARPSHLALQFRLRTILPQLYHSTEPTLCGRVHSRGQSGSCGSPKLAFDPRRNWSAGYCCEATRDPSNVAIRDGQKYSIGQVANKTGISAFSKTCLVAPPKIICLNRLCV